MAKKNNVDNVRYHMYCKIGTLTPCNDALKLHISKANYQAYIWRQSLVAQQEQLDLINHGWMHDDKENCLTLRWIKWS